MPIYTKKGDKGETGLPGKRRLSKTDQLFDFLGSLDQTSALIGLAVSYMQPSKDKKLIVDLRQIQQNFLAIGACIASENPTEAPILNKLPAETTGLEQQIDTWDAELPKLENFILAGGNHAGATLHVTRTSIRQIERNFHRLLEELKLEPISIYLNRLSDYFFQAARYYNFINGEKETIWKGR